MSPNLQAIKILGNTLSFAEKIYPCAVGKNGFSGDKKEGDGCSPIGKFLLRECWYRADKIAQPITNLPLKIIAKNDGWCDDVSSPYYNRRVQLPYEFSHEKLWRDDDITNPQVGFVCNNIYDIVIPIGYNDERVMAGKGSAIFLHIARKNYEGTKGCIALSKPDLLEILPNLSPQTYIEICP